MQKTLMKCIRLICFIQLVNVGMAFLGQQVKLPLSEEFIAEIHIPNLSFVVIEEFVQFVPFVVAVYPRLAP